MRSSPRDGETQVVFLANPNNPTGTYLPFKEVRRLHAGLPKQASSSCWTRPMPNMSAATITTSGIELVADRDNVVMTRTFSKIYGLAACASAGATVRRPSSTCSTACVPRSIFRAAIAAGVAAMAIESTSSRPPRQRRAGWTNAQRLSG